MTTISIEISNALEAVARDYILGWYLGKPDQVERALHPDLAKRHLESSKTGEPKLCNMSAMTLVSNTRARPKLTVSDRSLSVRVLDVFQRIATVRVDADDWVDYLHLVQVDGQWKIVNVLWELRV